MSLHLRKFHIVAAWAAIFVAGIAVGWLGARARAAGTLNELASGVRRAAIAFEPAELAQLEGTRADLNSPVHAALKQRLRLLRAATPQMLFGSILRTVPATNELIFLVDLTPTDSRPEIPPGETHPASEQRPGLRKTIETGLPAAEGPLADRLGRRVIGYAPIGELRAGAAPAREILVIEMDASNWSRELWLAGFRRAFFVWILLGLPLGAWLALRRQSEQREVIRNLSEAMEQSHSALLILDLESRIEYANRGLCQQIGYTRRELIGHRWRDFQATESAELADLAATVRTGKPWEGEWLNRRKDGSIYPVRGVVTPVRHRDGSLSCFVAVFEDVTEVKRREAELREARDLAEAGDRAKSQFLATMSHEVRTPLNGIVGFTSLLLETNLEPDQREYVQTIRASGEALIQLTGDILDFARIESGRLKLDPSSVDPRDCIEEALDLHAAKAAEKDIQLLHHVETGVPAAILIDGGRLRQILVNLIGNAVKFTESGEVEVTVAASRPSRESTQSMAAKPGSAADAAYTQSDVCTLTFAIRDTGIGIAPNQHAKLFKPFTQLDESSTRRYSGTGLGLAICRNLVHVLGGEISVTSEPGRGSTFTFTVRAPVAALAGPTRDLDGLQLGLVAEPGSLRRELVRLARDWRMIVHEASSPDDLVGRPWDVALVDLSDDAARLLAEQPAARPQLAPEKTFALVPITLSSEVRSKLRTHFRLLINKPVHHESLFAAVSGAQPRDPQAAAAPAQFGLRIMVVEDNPVNQRLMQRVLVNLGCSWMVVENGRLALEELSRHAEEYDVVLLDLHMPEMDGLTALQEIRRGNAGAHARTMWIIALTADAREEQRTRVFAAGVNDYLTKPLKVAELEAALIRFRTERPKRTPA